MPGPAGDGLTLVSLFAGCGGSSLGYKAAGYGVRLAVEWDSKAAATYRRNFPSTPVYEGDIIGLAGAEALRLAGVAEGRLDVLDGSPPCQGFSMAGKREFSDGRNRLFGEFTRLLAAFRPRAFIMENVGGLAKGKMRLAFAEMTAALKSQGYRVSCRLLNAWWYGVPQDRRRLIWVGIRNGLGVAPSHPAPMCARPVTIAEALGIGAAKSRPWGAIRNAQFKNGWRGDDSPAPTLEAARPPMVMEVHSGYKDARFRDGPAPTLCSGRKTRVALVRERLSPDWQSAEPGQEVVSWQSRKLKIGRPSYTQVAGRANWHPFEARYLTVGEAKVLQGFPEWFEVEEYKLIGNSVPPPMAEAVGGYVAGLLKGATA